MLIYLCWAQFSRHDKILLDHIVFNSPHFFDGSGGQTTAGLE